MISRKLSTLGQTVPCSQRAIRERGRLLSSDEFVLGQPGPSSGLSDEIGTTHDVSLRHGLRARKGAERKYVTVAPWFERQTHLR